MRVLCVGRHRYLSDHLAHYFRDMGLETIGAVGLEEALEAARRELPAVVLCDYDMLATLPLDSWERDEVMSRTPVVAVSLTRRPDEGHGFDINGIAGFLYLPTLTADEALAVIGGARRRSRYVLPSPLDWQRSTPARG